MSNCNAFIFVWPVASLSPSLFVGMRNSIEKCTSDWHSIYIFGLARIIYVNDTNINTAYLHFECRQSILNMPLWPLLVRFFFSSRMGFVFFFCFLYVFGFIYRWILFFEMKTIFFAMHVSFAYTIWISSKCSRVNERKQWTNDYEKCIQINSLNIN